MKVFNVHNKGGSIFKKKVDKVHQIKEVKENIVEDVQGSSLFKEASRDTKRKIGVKTNNIKFMIK